MTVQSTSFTSLHLKGALFALSGSNRISLDGVLRRLASEYGLERVSAVPFHPFVHDKMRDESNRALMETMRVLDSNGQFSQDCWEVAGVYMTFAFQKRQTR